MTFRDLPEAITEGGTIEARRILDPHHPTKLPKIEAALAVLGRHVELSLA